MSMRILVVGAHPDDAEIFCGGTMLKYALRGDKVIIACVTDGGIAIDNRPADELAAIRKAEASKAAALLGAELIWLGERIVRETEETLLKIVDVLRAAQPALIITHAPCDYHNDHNHVSNLVMDAYPFATTPSVKTRHAPCTCGPVYFMDTAAGVNFTPAEYVDITAVFSKKIKLFDCHKSQYVGRPRPRWKCKSGLHDMMEAMSRFRGLQVGVRHAEAFGKPAKWSWNPSKRLLP